MKSINNENTTDKVHAIFSPSSAERHLQCTPSLVMERLFPDETSDAAEEGTSAHALGEWKARKLLGLNAPEERPISEYDCFDMEQYTTNYAQFIFDTYKEYSKTDRNTQVMLEHAVDVSEYIPECFGTADCIIISNKVLHIIDLKYGLTKVSPVNNSQLKLYALGSLSDFGIVYPDIDTVRLTIYQPRVISVDNNGNRKQNIATWETTVTELKSWANIYARPRANMALSGEGKCNEGEWCKYCKAKAVCSAKRDSVIANLSLEDLQKKGDIITDEEVLRILEIGQDIVSYIESVKKYAEDSAKSGSKEWKGFTLTEGKGTRVFTSEKEVADRCMKIDNFNLNNLYETKFLSVAQLEKVLSDKTGMSKKEVSEMFSDLITRKPGNLKLTRVVPTPTNSLSISPSTPKPKAI